MGAVAVPEASNEIPAARDLLAKVPVANKTTLADALQTQTETAQQILFEGGVSYRRASGLNFALKNRAVEINSGQAKSDFSPDHAGAHLCQRRKFQNKR